MDGNLFWSGTVYETGTGRVSRQVHPARVQPNPAPTTNAAPTAGYTVRNEYSSIGLIRQRNHATNVLLWDVVSVAASGADLLSSTRTGNNLIETTQTDPWGRTKTNAVGTSTTVADRLSEGYTFDSESNLSARSWMDFGTPGSTATPVARAENFTYDSLNKLSNISGTTDVPAKAFIYDKYGNILSKDGRTYSYGNAAKPQQLSQITGSIHGATNPSYTYDANGNMLSGGGATISWMSFNMVNAIIQGSQNSSFRYGPEHQRVRQVAAYNGQTITTWYVENFELERNSTLSNTVAKYYIAGKVLYLEVGSDPTPTRTESNTCSNTTLTAWCCHQQHR